MACPKQPHLTRAAAEKHKTALIISGRHLTKPGRLNVYRCPDCALWHVGHQSPMKARRR